MKRAILVFAAMLLITGCGKPAQTGAPDSAGESPEAKYINEAVAFLQNRQPTEAILSLEKAIRTNPKELQSYMLMGQTYMHMNDFVNATETYRAALRVAPDRGELYYLLAMTYAFQGNKPEAINNAEKSLLIFQKERDEENFKRALSMLQGLSQ